MDTRKYLAELVGTFLFLTIGYLSVAAIGGSTVTVSNLLVVPFSFGLGLLAATFAVGHISGGHFNPAVTVGALLDRRIEVTDAIGYILAQVIGAIAAAVVVFVVSGQGGRGRHHPARRRRVRHRRAHHRVLHDRRVRPRHPRVPAAGGGARGARHPADAGGHPLRLRDAVGASVNPARSIGSALIGGDLSSLCIYIVGPIAGALAGWAVYWASSARRRRPTRHQRSRPARPQPLSSCAAATVRSRMKTLHLRTTGRRTGRTRRTPLYYVEDGEAVAIVTSNAGRDHEPAWWLNLQKEPDAVIEIRKDERPIRARPRRRTGATVAEVRGRSPQLRELPEEDRATDRRGHPRTTLIPPYSASSRLNRRALPIWSQTRPG